MLFKPFIMLAAFVGAVCVHCRLVTTELFCKMIGVMYIARSEGCGFNKPIFIHIDVCFKTIRGFTLAVRALLHIVIGFRVLGTIALFVFVWSIALGLNDASLPQGTISGYTIHLVHHANFAGAYVQALKAQLAVDLGQQYLHKI